MAEEYLCISGLNLLIHTEVPSHPLPDNGYKKLPGGGTKTMMVLFLQMAGNGLMVTGMGYPSHIILMKGDIFVRIP